MAAKVGVVMLISFQSISPSHKNSIQSIRDNWVKSGSMDHHFKD